jgi:hypothetical protein
MHAPVPAPMHFRFAPKATVGYQDANPLLSDIGLIYEYAS